MCDSQQPTQAQAPARRPRGKYRTGPHVYERDGYWHGYQPGDRRTGRKPQRFALGLRVRDADRNQAFAAFLDRLKSNGDPAPRAHRAPTEATLDAIGEEWLGAPHGWKPRTKAGNELLSSAFVESMSVRGVVYPSEMTDDTLDAWLKALRDAKLSSATINRHLTAARAMVRWASERRPPLCDTTPLHKRANLRELTRVHHRELPHPREIATVCAALRELDAVKEWKGAAGVALLVEVAVGSGLRLDEVRHLRPEDIQARAIVVAGHDGWWPKSWEERVVPVSPRVAETARAFVAWRDGAKGGKGKRLALGEHWINDRLDKAAATAKLPAFRMHDLRRVFATVNRTGGRDVLTIQRWLGHESSATTERYFGRLRGVDAAVAVDVLAG